MGAAIYLLLGEERQGAFESMRACIRDTVVSAAARHPWNAHVRGQTYIRKGLNVILCAMCTCTAAAVRKASKQAAITVLPILLLPVTLAQFP